MALQKKFLEIWYKEYGIASTSLCSLILIGIENIMETDFKCPEKEWRRGYSLCYICIPAVILFLLTIAFQKEYLKRCCRTCYDCFWCFVKIFLPSAIWIAILLLDGRYVACIHKTSKGNITTNNTELPSDSYVKSQIAGLSIILVIVFFFSIYKFSDCCNSDGREEIQNQPEVYDTSIRKQRCLQALMKDIVEPHVSVCLDKVWAAIEEEGLYNRSEAVPV